MKPLLSVLLAITILLSMSACASEEAPPSIPDRIEDPDPVFSHNTALHVPKIDTLPNDFIMGADISSLLSLEKSGRVFYGFDGQEQDLLKTLSEAGVNYIRVRVWNDPFDENGNGYGGGNCTVDTAIELGKRAAQYQMGLLVDFHYSDFWADPGKQQAPKAWQGMTLEEKRQAIYDYTAQSIAKIQQNGIDIGMVQVGNETTGGFCGESNKADWYDLMRTAAQAVRDASSDILIAVHYTNPEQKMYAQHAEDLKTYGVDYDVFATSYYPEFHGSLANMKEQLSAVQQVSGKKVMIAETSWTYSSDTVGSYRRSVQGQADEIVDCIRTMAELGGIGVFYWEPAWIDVPGGTLEEIEAKREASGAGWASSYAGSYDPEDAGKYYGGTACIPTSLFDVNGYPLESLRTFHYVRHGTGMDAANHLSDPSFEDTTFSDWKITENALGTVSIENKASDSKHGDTALHFWKDQPIEFTAEQTVSSLPNGTYQFSVYVQGDGAGENAALLIYAISDGVRYEQRFTLDGWLYWRVPTIEDIPCHNGTITVGIEIKAPAGAWGTIDAAQLTAT